MSITLTKRRVLWRRRVTADQAARTLEHAAKQATSDDVQRAFHLVKPMLVRLPDNLRLPVDAWREAALHSETSETPREALRKKVLRIPWGHAIIARDVLVETSLEFAGALVVLGDLTVGRTIEFTNGQDALVVGGNVVSTAQACDGA